MSIKKDINEALKKFTFFKNLPEFTARAEYLEERLKKGEKLRVRIDEDKLIGPPDYNKDFIYLEFQKKKGRPEKVLSINTLGDILFNGSFFKDYIFPPQCFEDYRPLPESQRA